jgi:hypothetical protein
MWSTWLLLVGVVVLVLLAVEVVPVDCVQVFLA